MEKVELIFIASPLMGHITQAIEMAKLMIHHNHQLSITFLLMKLPLDPAGAARIDSLAAASATHRLHFHHLPLVDPNLDWSSTNRSTFMDHLIEHHKPNVRDAVAQLESTRLKRSRLAGFLVDMLSTTMIDVADQFSIPSYIYFTSGAAFLGLILYFQTLKDEFERDHVAELSNSVDPITELLIPCFVKPVPVSVLPSILVDHVTWNSRFLQYARGYRKAKGIVINTFAELESHAVGSLENSSMYGKSVIPPIYTVGPILNKPPRGDQSEDLMKWLDDQPPASVVFLCFGSMGSFGVEQVREIAQGLERARYRFIWAIRKPPSKDNTVEFPGEFTDFEEILPEGFLDRTAAIGKVVGWAPQFAVLSHPAVGAFVSHCGWNSILESFWCGVPITTWPLYAEQQLNAFQMVKELGLMAAITLDYNTANVESVGTMVRAAEIEKGIKNVMTDEGIRIKVTEMRDKSRLSWTETGSSYPSFKRFLSKVMENTST
ncbi:hypothetical protein LguiA_026751 [Lonicera macranthoides]